MFHDKVMIQSYVSLPSPVPLLFPKQRKKLTTPLFMRTVLGGYAGQISRWTQHCRRQASLTDPCSPGPLSQGAWLYLEGLRWTDAEMQDKDVKPEPLAPSGSRRGAQTSGVFGGSCCVILSLLKARTLECKTLRGNAEPGPSF